MTLNLTLTLALTLRITKIRIISLVFIRFGWTKHQNISTWKGHFIHDLDFDLDLGFDLDNYKNVHSSFKFQPIWMIKTSKHIYVKRAFYIWPWLWPWLWLWPCKLQNTHILDTIHHKGACNSSFSRVLSKELD